MIEPLVVSKVLQNLPVSPGCYLYKDQKGKVIYVGKAKNLHKRVSSYFIKKQRDPHLRILVENIFQIEHIVTDSELEAFILETNLIKKYRPKYNRDLKDDKNYIWIMIDKSEDFPSPLVVRNKKKKNAIYLGPYHYTMPVKNILSRLRKVYPYRTCNRIIKEIKDPKTGKLKTVSSDPQPCLYYQLGLCPGPCAGYISKKNYYKNIKGIIDFFTKDHQQIMVNLRAEMEEYSKNLDYENAGRIRNKIKDIEYIKQRVTVESVETDETSFLEQKTERSKRALTQIIAKLPQFGLKLKKDFKIECFDISNIQGTNAVASMVVFVDGIPQNNLYRKFKIKTKDTPDDFAMMSEVLARRFLHKDKRDDISFSVRPDLIIVDGGKGQLGSAYRVLLNLDIDIAIIGLAKRNEDIFTIKDNQGELGFSQKKLQYGSEGLFLIQRIRDESHRFAINYHRKLRSYGQTSSILDDIPGIGSVSKKRLLQAFGNIEGVKKATDEELRTVIKNKKSLENLRKILN